MTGSRLSGCSEDDMIGRTGTEHTERVKVAVCGETRARRKKLTDDSCAIRHDKP